VGYGTGLEFQDELRQRQDSSGLLGAGRSVMNPATTRPRSRAEVHKEVNERGQELSGSGVAQEILLEIPHPRGMVLE
jgi:hypothetical protein